MDFLRGWPRGLGERDSGGAHPPTGSSPGEGRRWPRGCVLTVGSFDGLHRGHQALIHAARRAADARGLPLVALFFEPTAREYFSPASAPPRVLPLAAKLARLEELGVDTAWCLRFGRALAGMSAEAFAERLVAAGVRAVVAGEDFRFGRGRAGDAALLARVGIEVVTVPVVSARLTGVASAGVDAGDGPALVRCSSTLLRELLGRGAMDEVSAVLGAPYRLLGRVRRGRQLGRTLGCPTANLVFRRRLALAHGVYAGTARVADGWHRPAGAADDLPAVASFGVRPTLEGGLAPWLEVHLLNQDRDLYGRYLDFQPRHFLRPEARFDSLDALRAAIARDMDDARAWLAGRKAEAAPIFPASFSDAGAAHRPPAVTPDPATAAGRKPATTP